MNWPYQLPPPKETLGIAAAIMGILLLIVWGSTKAGYVKNVGLSADWICFNGQPGYPACVKDVRAK